MAFWNRKKAEPPAPPKPCARCAREKPAAEFPDAAKPETCATCLLIPEGDALRECPGCHEVRGASDFVDKVEFSHIHRSALADEQQRRAAVDWVLKACRHCKLTCTVCGLVYDKRMAERVFPDYPELVCFDHYRECGNRRYASKPFGDKLQFGQKELPPRSKVLKEDEHGWHYTHVLPVTRFTIWEDICDDCIRAAFPEPDVLPVLRHLWKLANLEHTPTSSSSTDAPPTERGDAAIGTDSVGGRVVLPLKVRNRHLYIVGRTGSGKTVTLKHLIRQDMEAGAGIGFLDPHGDAAYDLLGHVPEHRHGDVVYFCPTDEDCPTFNLLAAPYEPTKLTADIVSAFKMFFGDSWGFRMEQILMSTILTLLADRPNELHTFADIKRMLVHDEYRDAITGRVENQQLADFWRYEFPKFPKDATAPITNKLSQFLMPMSPLERLFSQPRNDLDAFTLMNEGKILLCNLSKGQLGDSAAFLIGALLTTALAQAALARVKIPEAERRDFFWYVDEFQNFAVSSFSSILSEARKYRLNLTLAHQYLDQVDNKLYSAIIGNVAAVVCLPVSPNDANTMAQLMGTTRTVQADGTLYDLKEGVEQMARRWLMVLASVLRFDSRGSAAVYTAEDHEDFVDETVRAVAPDLIARLVPGGDSPTGEIEFVPATFHEPPRFRMVVRQHLLMRIAEFVGDPHAHAFIPEGLKETRWPSAQDFLTLEPLSGYARIDNVDNVRRFSFPIPTDQPSETIRAAVLAAQLQRLKDTPTQRPRATPSAAIAVPPSPSTPGETTTPATPAAKPRDDFDEFLT